MGLRSAFRKLNREPEEDFLPDDPTDPSRPEGPRLGDAMLEPDMPKGPDAPAWKEPPAPPMRPKPISIGGSDAAAELERAQTADDERTTGDNTRELLLAAFQRRAPHLLKEHARTDQLAARKQAAAGESHARSQADLQDPNSDRSRQARSLLKSTEIGAKMAEMLGPDFERLPAAQLPGIQGLLEHEAMRRMPGQAKVRDPLADKKTEWEMSHGDQQSAEQARHNREVEAAMRSGAYAAGNRAGAAAEDRNRKEVDDKVIELGKQLPGDVADFNAKYERIKKVIAGNPKDIPGVGPFDARKPAFMSSDADLDVQKDAGQMLAAYQKLITGAGASDAERANLERISLDLKSENGFAAGLESLKQAYEAKVKDVRARFPAEVVSQFEAGQRREGAGTPPIPGSSGNVTVTNGKETFEIDEADLPAAQRDGFKAVR